MYSELSIPDLHVGIGKLQEELRDRLEEIEEIQDDPMSLVEGIDDLLKFLSAELGMAGYSVDLRYEEFTARKETETYSSDDDEHRLYAGFAEARRQL